MKPSTTRLGRIRRTAVVLGLGLLMAAGYFGCGRVPPEGFWEPTADDSAAITAWVEANKTMFSAAFNADSLIACDTVMPGTTATRLRGEVAENPFKQRIRYNALQHLFFTDSFELQSSFIATIDTVMQVAGGETTWVQETSATVTVTESIPGHLRIRAFSYTKYLRDSLFFPSQGETLSLPFFEQAFTPIDRVVVKEFAGATTDGAVLKKVNGTWQAWKYSGGLRFYAPNANDAPYVVYMNMVAKDTTVRINLRPDTLSYGIQRFYTGDELPTFRVGDSLTIRQTGVLSTIGDVAGYVFFRGKRYEFLTSKSDRVPLTEPGVYTLYATQIPVEVIYEVEGDRLELDPVISGGYVGTVWGIRIKVIE